jgi:hypothetical protein
MYHIDPLHFVMREDFLVTCIALKMLRFHFMAQQIYKMLAIL